MQQEQPLTPKYWAVHDKRTDDVMLETARKSLDHCIDVYVQMLNDENPELSYDDAETAFYDDENVEAILIEVRQVPT